MEKEKTLDKLQIDMKIKSKTSKINIDSGGGGIDSKRQLELVEQEATVLRTKVQTIEKDMEKLSIENKKLSLQIARNVSAAARKDSLTNSITLDKNTNNNIELNKIKATLNNVEKEKDELENKLKTILEISVDKLPVRIPKKFTDANTKMQLQVKFMALGGIVLFLV